jgi:hypothetical protein
LATTTSSRRQPAKQVAEDHLRAAGGVVIARIVEEVDPVLAGGLHYRDAVLGADPLEGRRARSQSSPIYGPKCDLARSRRLPTASTAWGRWTAACSPPVPARC